MIMVKVKVDELTGARLDWAVAEILKTVSEKNKRGFHIATFGPLFGKGYRYPCFGSKKFNPSENWDWAGVIIERNYIEMRNETGKPTDWETSVRFSNPDGIIRKGAPPLVLAMRTLVGGVLGEEIEVPEELNP